MPSPNYQPFPTKNHHFPSFKWAFPSSRHGNAVQQHFVPPLQPPPRLPTVRKHPLSWKMMGFQDRFYSPDFSRGDLDSQVNQPVQKLQGCNSSIVWSCFFTHDCFSFTYHHFFFQENKGAWAAVVKGLGPPVEVNCFHCCKGGEANIMAPPNYPHQSYLHQK